jgi:hypothetical protein
MRSIRVTSFMLAFACTLALVRCQHTPSKTTQSNQGAGSQAQAASAQAEPANDQAQAANVPAQSASNSGQSGAAYGSARSAAPVGPTQAAAPAPPAQDAPATHPDQSTQRSYNTQTGTEAPDNRAENQWPQVTIPDGTPVEIRLTQSLGSARSVSGQSFTATLDAPIVVDNAVVVARGANINGTRAICEAFRTPQGVGRAECHADFARSGGARLQDRHRTQELARQVSQET